MAALVVDAYNGRVHHFASIEDAKTQIPEKFGFTWVEQCLDNDHSVWALADYSSVIAWLTEEEDLQHLKKEFEVFVVECCKRVTLCESSNRGRVEFDQ